MFFLQIQVGDVRLMLPCGESQRTTSPEDSISPPGGNFLERQKSAVGSIDLEHSLEVPNMLVIVLAGFQATSRTSEPRLAPFSPAGKLCQSFIVSAGVCSSDNHFVHSPKAAMQHKQ